MADESPMTFKTWESASTAQLLETFAYYWNRTLQDAQDHDYEVKMVRDGENYYCGIGMLEFTFVNLATTELSRRGYTVAQIARMLKGNNSVSLEADAYQAFHDGFYLFEEDDEDGMVARTFEVLKALSDAEG